MAPKIGHRELLSLHQDRLEHHQANLNELTTNALRNPLREHLDMSGFNIKNARRIQTSNSLQVGTSITVGNSITINENIALGGNITDLDGNPFTFGGSGGGISLNNLSVTESPPNNTSSLSYNNTTGVFTYVPPVILSLTDFSVTESPPDNISSLKYDNTSGVFTYVPLDLIVNAAKQTFTQLLTEQPNKFNQNGSPTTSINEITINWNYTDIIPIDETIRKFAQGSTIKSRCLPYINEIKIQIYGTVTSPSHTSQSNTWLDYPSLSISPNEDYNNPLTYTTISLKTITFTKRSQSSANNSAIDNILSKTDSFSVRIYGINDSGNDFPNISTRALVIDGVSFNVASPPSKPLFHSNQGTFSGNQGYHLTSDFTVNYTEAGETNSAARLDHYITTFSEHSSLRSGYFSLSSQSGTTEDSLSNVQSNTNFTIQIGDNNLRAGTRYNYTITVSSDVSTENSPPSTQKLSPYTRLPTSSSYDTTLTLTKATQETHVTSSAPAGTWSANVIYLNTNISGKTQFDVSNTDPQTFEITKPYTITQETDNEGFGSFVENESGLVSISLKIDGTSKETITFNGFNQTSGNVGTPSRTPSQNSTTYFGNATIQDMYSDDNYKGFRLLGTVSLKNIDDNIYNKIGIARSNAYTLQYEYKRDSRVVDGPSDQVITTSYDVYVDDLNVDPSLTVSGTDSITVTSVEYCMGIPSVENFTVNLQRYYSNINSSHQFIRGDRLIGKIASIQNVSWSDTNFTSDPNINGNYSKNYSSTNEYYTASKNSPTTDAQGVALAANNLTITEYVYSLRGTFPPNNPNQISVFHYFDMASFTRDNNVLTPRLDLTNSDVYEITNSTELAKLGSDLGDIGVTIYSDHTNLVKDHTLLYINGNFRTNDSFNYPNVNKYTWDGCVPSMYNSGSSAFNTSGTSDNTNGYKWIVFRILKTNSSYVKTATHKGGGPDLPYIDLPALLISKGLGDINSTISTGFGNQDAIGFIRIFATRRGQQDGYQIGRFTSGANPSPNLIWYAGSLSTTISLNTLLAEQSGNNYGARIDTGNYNVDTGWGIECPTQSNFKNDNIDIFIALKNNASLP